MPQPKKLIEVAMPIKEISAESVRDKSIRHGHISTLHLWWARRPLPVCRAVVFASLVPDPLDENCPQAFKDAVQLLLGRQPNNTDPYKPYDDIPYTAAIDKMEDNLRNRLMMFIGKFSDKYSKLGEKTPSKDMLNEFSLIKWENKDNEQIIGNARKLIYVAHNSYSEGSVRTASAKQLLADFDKHYKAIKDTEQDLYSTPDRQIATDTIKIKEVTLENAIEAFLDKMPKVFDPFAGGGAIPLEAARLGCRSYGNDINPVAHIIQKGSLEFPQKYGKPITYSKEEFIKLYGEHLWNKQPQQNKKIKNGEAIAVLIKNRLAFDVEFYSKEILKLGEETCSKYYLPDKKYGKPLVYYWVKVGSCSNPSCNAEVPLLKQFYLSKRRTTGELNWVYLDPIIKKNQITFQIKRGKYEKDGWIARGNLICPCCGNTTDVNTLKQQFIKGKTSERILAVIFEKDNERIFRLPNDEEIKVADSIPRGSSSPTEMMPVKYTQALPSCTWGISKWGDLFNNRQLLTINTLVKSLNEIKKTIPDSNYKPSIITYLSILIDRILARSTSFGVWHILQETVEHPFGRQAIPMIFDYPEMNPFSDLSGAGLGQLFFILKYIESETSSFWSICNNTTSGEKEQFKEKSISAVVTDPPYYDAIAYADLSDFFYVWLKRSLSDLFPYNFSTPQTPKSDECTALKHHHNGSTEEAKSHFENKLLKIFDAIEHQTFDIVSIMFAHQSTGAWTTLCNSILGARMNITGSWAIDTEVTGALKSNKAFLSSSVTVSAKPFKKIGYGDYRSVKKSIENRVFKEVEKLYRMGFRGADLLTACFGQAVSEFGKYEKVEKADGSEVTVAELLEMARESAFNALLKGFDGDEFTKFYIGWLQLYGLTESEFDDAAKFSRVGLTINVQDLFTEHILIKNGNKQTLGGFQERLKASKNLGEKANSYLIDQVHKAMALYKGTNRNALLQYINKVASSPESSFWRVVTSLCEVLPAGSDDLKEANGLLNNKDSLIRESKTIDTAKPEQGALFNS